MLLKTFGSRPKFLARTSGGVWAIQSSTMKVVLGLLVGLVKTEEMREEGMNGEPAFFKVSVVEGEEVLVLLV